MIHLRPTPKPARNAKDRIVERAKVETTAQLRREVEADRKRTPPRVKPWWNKENEG